MVDQQVAAYGGDNPESNEMSYKHILYQHILYQ